MLTQIPSHIQVLTCQTVVAPLVCATSTLPWSHERDLCSLPHLDFREVFATLKSSLTSKLTFVNLTDVDWTECVSNYLWVEDVFSWCFTGFFDFYACLTWWEFLLDKTDSKFFLKPDAATHVMLKSEGRADHPECDNVSSSIGVHSNWYQCNCINAVV